MIDIKSHWLISRKLGLNTAYRLQSFEAGRRIRWPQASSDAAQRRFLAAAAAALLPNPSIVPRGSLIGLPKDNVYSGNLKKGQNNKDCNNAEMHLRN